MVWWSGAQLCGCGPPARFGRHATTVRVWCGAAGGREDADVRMLGEGRPFVLEIANPRGGHPPESTLREIEAALVAAGQ